MNTKFMRYGFGFYESALQIMYSSKHDQCEHENCKIAIITSVLALYNAYGFIMILTFMKETSTEVVFLFIVSRSGTIRNFNIDKRLM
jgi:succinate-acetate transporter protein